MQNHSSIITLRTSKTYWGADSAGRWPCPPPPRIWHTELLLAITQVRTWNFPALVKYLTPLKGLYFSPYMSRRLTFRPVGSGERHSDQRLKIHQLNTITINTALRGHVASVTWYGKLLYLQVNVEWGVIFRFGGSCLCSQTALQIRKLLGVQFPNVPNQHLPQHKTCSQWGQ